MTTEEARLCEACGTSHEHWTDYPLSDVDARSAFNEQREHNRRTQAESYFTGSTWDTEWDRAQPYIRRLVQYGGTR